MKPKRKRLDPNTVVLLKHIGWGLVVLALAALVLTGVWYGTRLPALTITIVEVSGGETIDGAVIEDRVQAVLEGDYFKLIPRRFAWFYPEDAVHEVVAETERIHHIAITRVSGTALKITYDEYVPGSLWCTSVQSNECVFLDQVGFAFAHAPALSGGSFLRFVTTGRDIAVGEQMAEEATFISLLSLQQLLAAQGWYISHAEIDQVGDAFLSVVGGGELKVTIADDPAQVVENLLVVLTSPEFTHITPGNFQYIDLRFGNKVFVNEELAVPEMETTSSTASSTLESGE